MSENQRDPQYKLRWPEELREKVTQSAKEHNRSMNADIVARLEDSFTKHTPDFAITSIIPAYLTGLISKYETQKIVNLSVLSKIEATSDESSIKFLKKEIERCEILLSEMQVLLKHFKSVYKLEDENKAP
ncbi:Arc family DNA-binding protein [Acinetobacter johnsonii]|uniref:Arc family DNA-binding protein n=1 Tax=Acinetobacter johnsonii TaxID=40214 RepID=UPI00244B50A3|nr:Arc family DNA-binding protein [Acinetobacter johnsonii]MDH1276159.1 Arc family DNA-binding protein [Acinetobacter johnsonii]